MNKTTSILLGLSATLLLVMGCSKDSGNTTNQQKMSSTGVTPTVVTGANNGGNVTCDEAAVANTLSGGYAFTTGKQDYPFNSSSFGNGVSVTTDGTYVSWSITPPAGYCVSNVAVIVKGGPAANVYYYNDGQSSDSGLASPVNASGNPAGLSNLTICYNLVECSANEDCQEETAYGGGIEGAGNAWWFALDASTSGSYPIYAGQQAVPGASVNYDATTDQITIVLGSQMQLQNVSEPVKVEGYNVLPSSRPAAGLFELYKGSNLIVQGNGSNYYVVHLDVEVCN
jgi:hypothetical protein